MAAETPTVIAPSRTIDICPRGDVYLVCGSKNNSEYGSVKIRVSSAVLSLSSKVFQAMFSPKFKEGTDLLQTTNPLEVELPDDNAQAMEAICDIVHLRNSSFAATGSLPPRWVSRIAALADKYDFLSALRLVSGMWLNNNTLANQRMGISIYHNGFPFMLSASLLFRDGNAFRHYGRRLMLEVVKDISKPDLTSFAEDRFDNIHEILVVLEEERLKYQRKLIEVVESEIQKHLLLRKSPGKALCSPTCGYAGEFTLTLMETLMAVALWPTTRIRGRSLSNSLRSIASVRALKSTSATKVCDTKTCELARSLGSAHGNPHNIKALLEASNRFRAEIRGPCMECFVSDGKVELADCKH